LRYISLFLKIILAILLAILLTGLTQVGGIIFLLSIVSYPFINKRLKNRWLRFAAKTTFFLVLYLTATFTLIPFIAKSLGRVPLPMVKTSHLKPLTIWTALLNRNYVRPALREATYSVARKMQKLYPGTTINYLDAGFPFKKLDIALLYLDKTTGSYTDRCPSPIGYGGSEKPKGHEPDRPADCASRGFWQYSLMSDVIPLGNSLLFDEKRTKAMTVFFITEKSIAKILIEPHLKVRFKLTSNKVRLHGCQAVRHDDHIHVQLH
jgi:hypothetical protein